MYVMINNVIIFVSCIFAERRSQTSDSDLSEIDSEPYRANCGQPETR
jgi:hypothetical protein